MENAEREEETDKSSRKETTEEEPSSSYTDKAGNAVTTTSTRNLFIDHEEAWACLHQLGATWNHQGRRSSSSNENSDPDSVSLVGQAQSRFADIVDRYLECPTVLDGTLEAMVQHLANAALVHIDEEDSSINRSSRTSSTTTNDDEKIPGLPSPTRRASACLSCLYALCKVRGYKTVTRCLPHAVATAASLWKLDRRMVQASRQHKPSDNSEGTWHARYVIRLWWTALAALPFGVDNLLPNDGIHGNDTDNKDTPTATGAAAAKPTTTTTTTSSLIHTVLADARTELDDAGPVRQAAAVCLAAWYSRPDLEGSALANFVAWAAAAVGHCNSHHHDSSASSMQVRPPSNHRLVGILQTLCALLKTAAVGRTQLVQLLMPPLWEPLWQLGDPTRTHHNRSRNSNHSNLVRTKYLQKWWTRMAVAHLPPSSRTAASVSTLSAADDLFFVPNVVEDVTGRLLQGLAHDATVVRWSAAKGLGRLVQVLPALCADDVVDALLEMLSSTSASSSTMTLEFDAPHQVWHGVCLTLAELARRGALTAARLPDVLPCVVQALQFDQPRTTANASAARSSIGAHVRDAACYTVWAWARVYPPEVLRPHVVPLAKTVLLVSLMDREVNCRRAASAAFQEMVGRQGAGGGVPQGIAILTVADFFALGNRTQAFTRIAHHVAQFKHYQLDILQHLVRVKLCHWDAVIRKLAAQSLALLSSYNPIYMGKEAFPFLLEQSLDPTSVATRHGAVLGVAELTKALTEQRMFDQVVTNESKMLLIDLVNEIDRRRLYRGRGGELMRAACCRLVECISFSKLSLTVKEQVRLLDTVDASIPHPSEEIQQCACRALGALLTAYFPVGTNGPSERLQSRVVDKFVKELRTSANVAVTRGYALAIGFLPAKLLSPSETVLGQILVALRETARPDARVASEGDAETRRNALFSLTRIVGTLRTSAADLSSIYPTNALNEKHINGILGVYMNSLGDYSTDRRGDVGSWCRMAAMTGLTTFLTTERPYDTLIDWCNMPGTTPTLVVGAILKQIGERLDAVRLHAGTCLHTILNDSALATNRSGEIQKILEIRKEDQTWADPRTLFTKLLQIAQLDNESIDPSGGNTANSRPYFDPVITGIVATAGGLASSTGKEALKSLTTFAKSLSGECLELFSDLLVSLWQKYMNQMRVSVPAMKCLEKLLLRQCLDGAVQSQNGYFAAKVLSCLEQERANCTDVKRLMLTADVAVALLRAFDSGDTKEHECAEVLCNFLGSPYPRLRAHVSQLLYMALLELPHLVGSDTEGSVLNEVVTIPWGTDMDLAKVRECVTSISEKLNLTRSKMGSG